MHPLVFYVPLYLDYVPECSSRPYRHVTKSFIITGAVSYYSMHPSLLTGINKEIIDYENF